MQRKFEEIIKKIFERLFVVFGKVWTLRILEKLHQFPKNCVLNWQKISDIFWSNFVIVFQNIGNYLLKKISEGKLNRLWNHFDLRKFWKLENIQKIIRYKCERKIWNYENMTILTLEWWHASFSTQEIKTIEKFVEICQLRELIRMKQNTEGSYVNLKYLHKVCFCLFVCLSEFYQLTKFHKSPYSFHYLCRK